MSEVSEQAIAIPSGRAAGAGQAPDPEQGWEAAEGFELTEICRGPWGADTAHGGAPAALLAGAAERGATGDGFRVASLAFTFLSPVALGPVAVRRRVLKPGRLQRVIECELLAGGRVAMALRAGMLRRAGLELPQTAAAAPARLPRPEDCEPVPSWVGPPDRAAFHKDGVEVRKVEAGPAHVGPTGTAWLRLRVPVLDGRRPSPAQRAAATADFGNGIAHPVSFETHLFANCDLNISMQRDPVGEWVALDSRTEVSAEGAGVTVTDLHDLDGRFGAAMQTLYVDRR